MELQLQVRASQCGAIRSTDVHCVTLFELYAGPTSDIKQILVNITDRLDSFQAETRQTLRMVTDRLDTMGVCIYIATRCTVHVLLHILW
jgi:hypothetical protein